MAPLSTAGSTRRRPSNGSRTWRPATRMARHFPATSGRAPARRGLGAGARAFTLAEALIASVVLATAVVGLAGVLSVSSSQARAMDVDATSLALARQLMEEVLARPFDPPAVNDRAGWKSGNHDKSS